MLLVSALVLGLAYGGLARPQLAPIPAGLIFSLAQALTKTLIMALIIAFIRRGIFPSAPSVRGASHLGHRGAELLEGVEVVARRAERLVFGVVVAEIGYVDARIRIGCVEPLVAAPRKAAVPEHKLRPRACYQHVAACVHLASTQEQRVDVPHRNRWDRRDRRATPAILRRTQPLSLRVGVLGRHVANGAPERADRRLGEEGVLAAPRVSQEGRAVGGQSQVVLWRLQAEVVVLAAEPCRERTAALELAGFADADTDE